MKIKTKKKLSTSLFNIINKYIGEKQLFKIFLIYFRSKINNYNFCIYQYTYRKDKNITRVCGNQFYTKYEYSDKDKFLCAEHNR